MATLMKCISDVLTGGLTAARAVLGFNFHIIVAQIANLIVCMMVGRGLTLAANAALQKFAGLLFGTMIYVSEECK
ncbi:hypothetical protein [Leadbettera azotonutricia]|uniref:Uncharacterized protein n=1 Tax=Leadbettera azotonutricia (strain ATCC BAA-888 / DSM 13862 / ZAS-9) TaxID=545695 RepID=F5YCI7_LEAAZ|nr:hypothetical protein [Leadbettera azotonutricia]AEF81220.1 conserved hypothetical protein [Leadbettera azotonutricia ZAS-9]